MVTVMMALQDVTRREQFEEFYISNGLNTVEERVDKLRSDMKIEAICGEREKSLDEIREMLENVTLLGYWRAFV